MREVWLLYCVDGYQRSRSREREQQKNCIHLQCVPMQFTNLSIIHFRQFLRSLNLVWVNKVFKGGLLPLTLMDDCITVLLNLNMIGEVRF